VFVCNGRGQAIEAVNRITADKQFGEAGSQLVIEERLDGEEASVLAFTDSRTIIMLPAAQDHKAAQDGDRGPNTGGMGAYCPTPLISDADLHRIQEQILIPVIHAMRRIRRPFRGVLYAGLMMTNQGPKVLEFNVRFGDPECQAILMRLSSDLVPLLEAVADDHLERVEPPKWDPRPAISVVMASAGYPGDYKIGLPIRGLEEAARVPNVKVFHSGTAMADGKVVTNGGRVLCVTAFGDSISAAKLAAYTAVKQIRWEGAWCRKDISDKALRYAKREELSRGHDDQATN
jgi:phosphoribosylamine--glycine ligase